MSQYRVTLKWEVTLHATVDVWSADEDLARGVAEGMIKSSASSTIFEGLEVAQSGDESKPIGLFVLVPPPGVTPLHPSQPGSPRSPHGAKLTIESVRRVPTREEEDIELRRRFGFD